MTIESYQGEGGLPDLRKRATRRAGHVTLDGNGEATVTFDPVLEYADPDAEPVISATAVDDPGNAVVIQIASKTQNAEGQWTSAVIRGARITEIPTVMNLGQLFGMLLASNSDASGVRVDWMAI